MADQDRILERVRKMLALANDEAASEGERDNALRMAHNLMSKHQLDMMDVEAHLKDKQDPRGEYFMEGWNMPWCRQIRNTIAKLFMCSYYYQKINATRGKHSFVGRESNATTAMLMGDWIVRGLLKEADARYGHRLTPAGRSFGEGAASRLAQRVRALQATTAQEVGQTGALALLDLAKSEGIANEDWIANNVGQLRAAKRRDTGVDMNAYRDGHSHAGSINLNTQLSNKKGTLAIK